MGSKKTRVTNEQILQKLTKAGLVPYSRYSVWDRLSDNHLTEVNNFRLSYSDYQLWDNGFRGMDLYIPLDIYTQVGGVKFKPQLNIGTRVAVRHKSTRLNHRNPHIQNVGDIYDWKHLGIGSGKAYVPDSYDGIRDSQFRIAMNNEILLNANGAKAKAHEFKVKGLYYVVYSAWIDRKTMAIKEKYQEIFKKHLHLLHRQENGEGFIYSELRRKRPYEFHKTAKIYGDGVLGRKKSVEGYITEIYIYMKYPQWKSKREARYEVMFDTGAKAIFTADWLKKSFTTDYDYGENLSVCEFSWNCDCSNCDHKEPHEYNEECEDKCDRYGQDKGCIKLYDYSNLTDLTVGKGILEK